MKENDNIKFIKYKGSSIEYILKREKRKSISIKIKEGKIYIFSDTYSSLQYIENFMLKNIENILKQIENTKLVYREKEKVLIFGFEYKLCFNYNKSYNNIEILNNNLIANLPLKNKGKQLEVCLESFYKKLLAEYLEQSFKKFTEMTNLFPKKVYIKKMSTRWGSCSSNSNISINLNLVKFHKDIIDYVVLHEICHLKEMNHSKDFWNLLSLYMPDYKQRKLQLKI